MARLEALGVTGWDTAPPEQGRIRFLADGAVVAHARYRVILSYGPDDRYTMGWDVAAYRAAGIPFVGRDQAGEPAIVHGAGRSDAWDRGLAVARAIDCTAIYWASTLLLAIDDLVEGDERIGLAPGTGTRMAAMAAARLPAPEPALDVDGAGKRAVYDHLRASTSLRPELLDALVFVLEGDLGEIEACRAEVTADDVPELISAYWKVPAWRPRADLLHLLMDRREPELEPLWHDILAAPDRRAEDSIHQAKAVALAGLDGDPSRFDDYWLDWERTCREARRRVLARG